MDHSVNDNKITTKSRHNLPLNEVEWMEEHINRGIYYEKDDARLRLAFVIHGLTSPRYQTGVFYYKGHHHSTFNFPIVDRPEAARVEGEEPMVA